MRRLVRHTTRQVKPYHSPCAPLHVGRVQHQLRIANFFGDLLRVRDKNNAATPGKPYFVGFDSRSAA
jgi:hypothetical protein